MKGMARKQRGETVKKFINGPETLEADVIRGLALSKPGLLRQLPDCNVLVRQTLKRRDKVSLLFGCGTRVELLDF